MKNRKLLEHFGAGNWWKTGIGYGIFMMVFMEIFNQIYQQPILFSPNWYKYALIWLLGGLVYGYTMHRWYMRKKKRQLNNSHDN
ncbi:MAG: hypothetical protein ACK417_05320 [Bacteroidia bacterium]|jgi:hypothetical protein